MWYIIALVPSFYASAVPHHAPNHTTPYVLEKDSIPYIELIDIQSDEQNLRNMIKQLSLSSWKQSILEPDWSEVMESRLNPNELYIPLADPMQVEEAKLRILEHIRAFPISFQSQESKIPTIKAFIEGNNSSEIIDKVDALKGLIGQNFSPAIVTADPQGKPNQCIYRLDQKEFSVGNILRLYFHAAESEIADFETTQQVMNVELLKFLEGGVYGTGYSPEKMRVILDETVKAVNQQFPGKLASMTPVYHATAGAPGSGKSYHLENMNAMDPLIGAYSANAVYIDPDRVSLFGLEGYKAHALTGDLEGAYTAWRDASNFISNFMMVMAASKNLNIIHGTTSTSPRILDIYKGLKQKNYTIEIDIIFASATQRANALTYRQKKVVQETADDAIAKVKPVFERMADGYFIYGDVVKLYRQNGEFWLGSGERVHFASYSPTEKLRAQQSAEAGYYQQLVDDMTMSYPRTQDFEQLTERLDALGATFCDKTSEIPAL